MAQGLPPERSDRCRRCRVQSDAQPADHCAEAYGIKDKLRSATRVADGDLVAVDADLASVDGTDDERRELKEHLAQHRARHDRHLDACLHGLIFLVVRKMPEPVEHVQRREQRGDRVYLGDLPLGGAFVLR